MQSRILKIYRVAEVQQQLKCRPSEPSKQLAEQTGKTLTEIRQAVAERNYTLAKVAALDKSPLFAIFAALHQQRQSNQVGAAHQ